jgi:hypothetical protein
MQPQQEESERSVLQRRAVTTLLLAFTPSIPSNVFSHIQEKTCMDKIHRQTLPTASDGKLSESDLVRLERARLIHEDAKSLGSRKPRFLPWIRAREWARSTHMETESEWKEWIDDGEKKVPLIPSNPDEVYADSGWEGWQDFLNNPVDSDTSSVVPKDTADTARFIHEDDESVRKRKPRLLPWTSAREWARSTHLETESDWKEWIDNGEKKQPLIPSNPDEVYAVSGWEGWHDFLNEPVDSDRASVAPKDATEKARLVDEDIDESVRKRKPRILPWISARIWARSMHMETEEDWKEWIDNGEKKTPLIPSNPDEAYADSGWEGWHDFLNEPVDS